MSKRYRIAIVTRSFPPKSGGIASAHYNLYQLLSPGHEVEVFVFDDDDPAPIAGVHRRKSSRLASAFAQEVFLRYIHRRDPGAFARCCRGLASVMPACFCLSHALERFSPDVIIAPDNFVPLLAMRVPKSSSVIWMSRNNYKRFESQPLVAHESWMDIHLAHRMELRAMRKAHWVVCPSEYMRGVFQSTYPVDLPISVIYNFVNPTVFRSIRPTNLRERLKLDSSIKLIYIPSGGSPMKGKRYVFELIRRLSNAGKAAFYISGPIDSDLQQELESIRHLAEVYAPGHLPYHENLEHVAACDFAISPTLIENLSNAIVEGLMLGVPFVTFDTGGNKEIVHSGVNGQVVPYLDVEGLVHHAGMLLKNHDLLAEFRSAASRPLHPISNPDILREQYGALFANLRRNYGPSKS